MSKLRAFIDVTVSVVKLRKAAEFSFLSSELCNLFLFSFESVIALNVEESHEIEDVRLPCR